MISDISSSSVGSPSSFLIACEIKSFVFDNKFYIPTWVVTMSELSNLYYYL